MLTTEQRAKLETAIARAEQPGLCKYAVDKKRPCCVIGQLAFLEGVSVEELHKWDVSKYGTIATLKWKMAEEFPLAKYDSFLLQDLQKTWDRSPDEEEGQFRMRRILNGY